VCHDGAIKKQKHVLHPIFHSFTHHGAVVSGGKTNRKRLNADKKRRKKERPCQNANHP
jgi:hypothetical protein